MLQSEIHVADSFRMSLVGRNRPRRKEYHTSINRMALTCKSRALFCEVCTCSSGSATIVANKKQHTNTLPVQKHAISVVELSSTSAASSAHVPTATLLTSRKRKRREAKYTCPRCGVRTCSVACCKKHKIDTKCNGKKDQTGYVSLKEYDEKALWNGKGD